MPRSQRNTPDDAARVLQAFRCIVKSLRIADRAASRDHGLGASQLFVLHELMRAAPLSVGELAERMATDQSTMSVVVSKLIEKGFVAGKRSQSDARRRELSLTAKGKRALGRMPPPIQKALIDAVRELPRARAKALADTLMAVVGTMGIADENPPLMFADDATSAAPSPRPPRDRSARSRTGTRTPA